jgi:hypothetical protein
MKKPYRQADGFYHVDGKKYKTLFGSREQVMNGTVNKTTGGLTKADLVMNKWGRIVSAKKFKTAKKEMRLQKHGFFAKKGKFGAVTRKLRGGKVDDGVAGPPVDPPVVAPPVAGPDVVASPDVVTPPVVDALPVVDNTNTPPVDAQVSDAAVALAALAAGGKSKKSRKHR